MVDFAINNSLILMSFLNLNSPAYMAIVAPYMRGFYRVLIENCADLHNRISVQSTTETFAYRAYSSPAR